MSDAGKADAVPKKKGKVGKIVAIAAGGVVLLGGGVGAGLYAAGAGVVGGAHDKSADDGRPQLVPKAEQKRAGEEAGAGKSDGEADKEDKAVGRPTPVGEGGDRYASNYYALEKEFTANLQDSVHFIQVGVAISTPYDDTVIQNIRTNDIAIRSAILMALGDTTEDQVFTSKGKDALAKRLAVAINSTLEQKEGFGGIGNVYFTNFVVQ